jgi:hypothetical protein
MRWKFFVMKEEKNVMKKKRLNIFVFRLSLKFIEGIILKKKPETIDVIDYKMEIYKKEINSKSVYARTTGFTAIGKVTERLIEPL